MNQKVLSKVLQRVTPNSAVFVANNGLEALQVLTPSSILIAPLATAVLYKCT